MPLPPGESPPPSNPSILFIGDPQRTFIAEILIGREQNDGAREMVVNEASQLKTDAVFFLGDLVAVGSFASDWKRYDRLVEPLVRKKIPLFNVYGNHDYFFWKSRSECFMQKRFPHLKEQSWGIQHFGETAVVYLDSNRSVLGRNVWIDQLSWFRKTLQSLDANETVKTVNVVLHHPPYTNSVHSRASHPVRLEVVPIFLSGKKTRAMISGHCHAYERFTIEGRSFIVAGGGGGPRVKLLPKEKQIYPDHFVGPSPRPFHFLQMTAATGKCHFTVYGFDKGEPDIRVLDRFDL